MADMKKLLTSRDCSVKIDKDGKITINNSMLPQGVTSTYIKKEARTCLLLIASMGDVIPVGAMDEVS